MYERNSEDDQASKLEQATVALRDRAGGGGSKGKGKGESRECSDCGEVGHLASDSPELKKGKGEPKGKSKGKGKGKPARSRTQEI